MDSLAINQCDSSPFECKFLAMPDWLNGESESDNIRFAVELHYFIH